MLYFAYGSNLNHAQMKRRCKSSRYQKKTYLKNYKLSFCWNGSPVKLEGKANVVKKTGAKIPGGLWKISFKDEKMLDRCEGYPNVYTKKYFKLNKKKVLFYILNRKCEPKRPKREYVNTMVQGYKDCNLDIKYLKRRLIHYSITF